MYLGSLLLVASSFSSFPQVKLEAEFRIVFELISSLVACDLR